LCHANHEAGNVVGCPFLVGSQATEPEEGNSLVPAWGRPNGEALQFIRPNPGARLEGAYLKRPWEEELERGACVPKAHRIEHP